MIFPLMLWFLVSNNQPFLEQLAEPLPRRSLCQSLLQELQSLILGVMLEGTCALFLTEVVVESTRLSW